jgi:hypothetical protein
MDYIPTAQLARLALEDEQKTTLSQIAIEHIKAHVKAAELYKTQLEAYFESTPPSEPPSLSTIAVNSMVNSLRLDPSSSNFKVVLQHTPPTMLGHLIDSPKLHYTSLLQFMRQKGWDGTHDGSQRDLWILRVRLDYSSV